MTLNDLHKVSFLSLIVLVFFALYFYLVGYKENIPVYIECMRAIFTLHYLGLMFMATRMNLSNELVYSILFLSFIGLSYTLFYWRLSATGSFYGSSFDSYFYMDCATKFNDMPIWEYWQKVLTSSNANLDDLGFTTIMYIIAKPFGKNYIAVINVLILCNSFIYIAGVKCFNKLSMIIFDGDDRRAMAATLLWAGFTRLITTSAGGAKEVFFTTFVIIAMYNIYKYKLNSSIAQLITTVLFITICLFFRFAICYALVLSFICIVISNEQNRKTVVKGGFVLILFTVPLLTFFLPLLIGTSLEHVLWVTGNRMGNTGGGSFTRLIFPPLTLLFGPLPNLDRLNGMGFSYSYSLFLKDFLSVFFLSNFVKIVREYNYRYYPIIVFVFCNMLMLIVAGVTLDVRYHITYLPFFFLICMAPVGSRISIAKLFVICVFICTVVFFYSSRSFSVENNKNGSFMLR